MKEKVTIINLTGHPLNIFDKDRRLITIPPSGLVARAELKNMPFKSVNNILIQAPCWSEITDLPAPKKDTIYVVSRLVKNMVPGRYDVVCPGSPVTNSKKERIGADGFLL